MWGQGMEVNENVMVNIGASMKTFTVVERVALFDVGSPDWLCIISNQVEANEDLLMSFRILFW